MCFFVDELYKKKLFTSNGKHSPQQQQQPLFNGHYPQGKWTRMFPFWILLELRMMEVVLTGGAIRRVISSQISTNNKPTASCLQGGWSVFLGRMLINGESGYTCMSEAKGHHFEHLIHWTGSFQNHHHRAQPALLRVTNSLPRKHVKLRVISVTAI